MSSSQVHVDAALKVVLPSVSRRDEARYKSLAGKIRQSRAHVTEDGDNAAPPPAQAAA